MSGAPGHPRLRAGTIALCRGDGELQFGISDDLAVTVPLPSGVRAPDALAALHLLDGETPVAAVAALARGRADRAAAPTSSPTTSSSSAPELAALDSLVSTLLEVGVLEVGEPEAGAPEVRAGDGGVLDSRTERTATSSVPPSPSAALPSTPRPAAGAPGVRATVVHVIGRGDMSRRIEAPLRHSGFAYGWSERQGLDLSLDRPPWRGRPAPPPCSAEAEQLAGARACTPPLRDAPADLVVLADDLVPDPVTVAALHRGRTPHLYLACRDGRVVVGPTVAPGRSSCLRCADHYRTERNPAWPRLSAQLLFTSGWAPVPSRVAAAALVLSEVEKLRDHGVEGMVTYGHTVEISVAEGIWRRRRWAPHPECDCGAWVESREKTLA